MKKSKLLIIVLAVLIVFSFILTACNKKSNNSNTKSYTSYQVTFDLDGGKGTETAQSSTATGKVTKPNNPTKSNYIFDNWYTSKTYSTAFDFDDIITKDITVYAKWNNAFEQIKVSVYIDGKISETVYTDSSKAFKITAPNKPVYQSTNPNTEKYFYGWFLDSNYQTPYTEDNIFKTASSIYGKWIDVYTNAFQYSVNSGKATITGFTNNTATIVVVPSYINSFPVTAISGAFSGKTMIREIIFDNAHNLLTDIGGSAFYNCNTLTNITIPDSVTSIGGGAFYNCSGLTNITIPLGVKSIGDYAFYGCSRLTNITIPSGVTSIGGSVFSDCIGLTSIIIPNSVTSIGNYAFSGCNNLKSVFVDNSNSNYASQDGILYNKAKTQIIYVPKAISGSITIPNSVTSIGNYVFYGCTGLTGALTIPSSVTSIGSSAFYGCTGLSSITIPSGVTSIGSSAFYGWKSSQTIYIKGRSSAPSGWASGWNSNCSANIVWNA